MKSGNQRSSLKLSTQSAIKYKMFEPKKLGTSINGGPTPKDQLFTIAKGQYWTILNSHILNTGEIVHDDRLRYEVNALKHSLQTYGPHSENLPDCRPNTGKAKGSVFHGHCKHSSGTVYVLEWSEIDPENKIIALTNFGTHENFQYAQCALCEGQISNILSNDKNKAILEKVELKRLEAERKLARIPVR